MDEPIANPTWLGTGMVRVSDFTRNLSYALYRRVIIAVVLLGHQGVDYQSGYKEIWYRQDKMSTISWIQRDLVQIRHCVDHQSGYKDTWYRWDKLSTISLDTKRPGIDETLCRPSAWLDTKRPGIAETITLAYLQDRRSIRLHSGPKRALNKTGLIVWIWSSIQTPSLQDHGKMTMVTWQAHAERPT